MARLALLQNSFNAGEFSPRMYGRTDLRKYVDASRTVKNFQITPQGGLLRRSGTRFVRELKDSTKKGRLIDFVVSDIQAYVLSFEEGTIRFYLNEGTLLEQALDFDAVPDLNLSTNEFISIGHGYRDGGGPLRLTTTGTLPGGTVSGLDYTVRLAHPTSFEADATEIDDTNDEIIVAAGHGYADQMGPFRLETTDALPGGLEHETDYYIVFVSTTRFGLSTSPGGAKEDITSVGNGTHTLSPTPAYLRDRFRIAKPNTDVVDLTDTGSGTHTLTPTNPQPVEVESPYLESELFELTYAQSADVLYIVHKNHPPRKLSRFSPQGFFLEEIEFQDGPYLAENTDLDHTLQPSATSGNAVTITSSEAFFRGVDVGRLIRIQNGAHWGYAKITAVNPINFTDADIESHTFDTVDVNTGTDEITVTSHGMDTGELVRLVDGGGGLPNPLAAATDYYVRAVSASLLAFYLTRGDAIGDTNRIVLTTNGGNGNSVTTSVIDIVAHGYTGGEGPVRVSNTGGALPDGLSSGVDYFIVFVGANSLALATSPGGTPVGINSAAGGGTHTITLEGETVKVATCTVSVKADFDTANATTRWRMSAWGEPSELGYPRAVSFHEQRLWFAANPGAPQNLYGSKTADFEVFSPSGDLTDTPADLDDTIADDNAVNVAIGANDVNVIQWLAAARTLLLGTTSANWTAQAALVSEAITPTNIQVKRSSAHGSKLIQPIVVDDRAIYVSDTGLKLFGIGYAFENDAYIGEDLSLLAEHITRSKAGSGIEDLDYAHEPWTTAFAVRADGVLLGITLLREQEIVGWVRHELGGVDVEVESVAVIPSPDGDASSVGRANRPHDQVWVTVKRTIGGETKRFVEFFEDHFDDDDDVEDAFFVDSGVTYNGAAATTIPGFTHLAGETVDVLANGKVLLAQTVSAQGELTLEEAASKVHAGYGYVSDWESLRQPVRTQSGFGETDLKRIDHLVLRLHASLGGKVGPDLDNLEDISALLIPADLASGTLPPLFSDDVEVALDGEWATYGRAACRQDQPLPWTVTMIGAKFQVAARGDRK